MLLCKQVAGGAGWAISVSYTHLDVYKRQYQKRPAFGPFQCLPRYEEVMPEGGRGQSKGFSAQPAAPVR